MWGTITQQHLLQELGIGSRLQSLVEACLALDHLMHDHVTSHHAAINIATPCCRQAAEDKGASVWGPITQQHLLQELGIGFRLQSLVEACPDPAEQEALYQGALRLVSPSSSQVGALDAENAWMVQQKQQAAALSCCSIRCSQRQGWLWRRLHTGIQSKLTWCQR